MVDQQTRPSDISQRLCIGNAKKAKQGRNPGGEMDGLISQSSDMRKMALMLL